jgi:HEAT repeat protein
MAAAMEVLPQLADALIERLEDEDHLVRVAAADALQHCTADDVRKALLTALGDKSVAVQLAAKNSLQTLGIEVPTKPPTSAALVEATP